jgi:hypothetical protein
MANRMLNHTLNQPVGQAAIHHAFERLSDAVFDVVADLAFKNGERRDFPTGKSVKSQKNPVSV